MFTSNSNTAIPSPSKERRVAKGDDCRVVGTQKLFHPYRLKGAAAPLSSQHNGNSMSLDQAASKPHERLNAALTTDLEAVNEGDCSTHGVPNMHLASPRVTAQFGRCRWQTVAAHVDLGCCTALWL